ncbi:MAG: hemerythrin domain-containing protein [Nitrospirae bacterium]|nr:hemerythrin domain-containing protein [Nitrospirota bacterium]
MTKDHLRIKYRCQHPDCQIKSCRTGEIDLDQDVFEEMSSSQDDKTLFRSPRNICRLGFSQTFKALDVRRVSDISEDAGIEAESEEINPVSILREEHQGVLRRLDVIEDMIIRRDINGLWIAMAEVENDIVLHSLRKEEGVLFPLLIKLDPLNEKYIEIIKEDHRELMVLLHSVRNAMCDDDIPDNVLRSALSNLRSHISKEDEEFFAMIEECLNSDDRRFLVEEMGKAEQSHVVITAGERTHGAHEHEDASPEQMKYREAVFTARQLAEKDHCH